jgi:regulator of sigma E protease
MTIILFIVVLAVLIIVHELGHFLVAKKNGIRVDEFGLGYPPKLWGYQPKGSETEYTLNWLPFGGFVKIFGENPDQESTTGPDSKRSFINKPARIQALVLVAGVFFNALFAWLLLSIAFMIGFPTVVTPDNVNQVKNPQVVVTEILPDSPAAESGLQVGDRLLGIESGEAKAETPLTIDEIQQVVGTADVVNVTFARGNNVNTIAVETTSGIVDGNQAIGIGMENIGNQALPVFESIWQGLHMTGVLAKETVIGFWHLISGAVTGTADFSQVAGPVGIVGIVGNSAALGLANLLSIVGVISLNLAILNLIPFPALDGGRLLFVIIEKIKGSPIAPRIANTVNLIGFALLILLMLVVTYHDILRLI